MNDRTETRTAIMDAFGVQLAAAGYQGISLVGVARTVGIQKPSIYYHFPGGKEELYAAVALQFISQYHRRLDAALDSAEDLEGKLLALVGAVADHTQRSISFEQRIYDALEHVSDQTRDSVSAQYVDNLLKPVVAPFSVASEDGDIVGDPWFLMNAFLHLARSVDSGSGPDAAASIVGLFLHGARPH